MTERAGARSGEARLSRLPPPTVWVASMVPRRQDQDLLVLDLVVDRERKAPQLSTSRRAIDERPPCRGALDPSEHSSTLRRNSVPSPGSWSSYQRRASRSSSRASGRRASRRVTPPPRAGGEPPPTAARSADPLDAEPGVAPARSDDSLEPGASRSPRRWNPRAPLPGESARRARAFAADRRAGYSRRSSLAPAATGGKRTMASRCGRLRVRGASTASCASQPGAHSHVVQGGQLPDEFLSRPGRFAIP